MDKMPYLFFTHYTAAILDNIGELYTYVYFTFLEVFCLNLFMISSLTSNIRNFNCSNISFESLCCNKFKFACNFSNLIYFNFENNIRTMQNDL